MTPAPTIGHAGGALPKMPVAEYLPAKHYRPVPMKPPAAFEIAGIATRFPVRIGRCKPTTQVVALCGRSAHAEAA